MRMHREVPPPALRDVAPDAKLSAAMEAVVARALAKVREARFASAANFAAALDATPEATAPGQDARDVASDATVADRRLAQPSRAPTPSPEALAPTANAVSRWLSWAADGAVIIDDPEVPRPLRCGRSATATSSEAPMGR